MTALGVWVGTSLRQGSVCAGSMTKAAQTFRSWSSSRVNYALFVVMLVMWLLQDFHVWAAGLVRFDSEHEIKPAHFLQYSS